MSEIALGWELHADVGPEWLFLRLNHSGPAPDATPPVAERAWQIAQQRDVYRIVVELDANVWLTSHLVGQLVMLLKRSHRSGGVTRICGFSERQYQALQIMSLAARFPNYLTREDAVLGRQ